MSLLVAPGLLAHPAACRAQAALARLAAYAPAPQRDEEGLTLLVCGLLAGLGARPVGALAALGAGLAVDGDYWLVADPVSLAAGSADVLLQGSVRDLTRADADELVIALNAHFHDDGVAFVAPRPDLWLAHMRDAPALATHPLEYAAVAGFRAALPGGEAGPQWRRWQDEMQMLLHPHPVNEAREAAGALPANAVWMWGGGRVADAGPVSHIEVEAPVGLVGDMLRGLAVLGEAHAEAGAPPRKVHVTPIASDEDVTAFVDGALEPALAQLERGTLRELMVAADGNGVAAAWLARRPTRWARTRARWRAPPFTVPLAD